MLMLLSVEDEEPSVAAKDVEVVIVNIMSFLVKESNRDETNAGI
jgi:hypothetical protein